MYYEEEEIGVGKRGGGLFVVGAVAYLGFVLLFCYQTIMFLNWLFPDDQWLIKVLTVLCFDGASLFWAAVDTFYEHASPGAGKLTKWSWGISFILSFIASVFYMVIQSFFRFHLTPDINSINIGYGIAIGAVTYQVLAFTFWLRLEYMTRNPKQNIQRVQRRMIQIPARLQQTADYSPRANIANNQYPQATITEEQIIRLIRQETGKQPAIEPPGRKTNKPFLASQARELSMRAARPKKKLPLLKMRRGEKTGTR